MSIPSGATPIPPSNEGRINIKLGENAAIPSAAASETTTAATPGALAEPKTSNVAQQSFTHRANQDYIELMRSAGIYFDNKKEALGIITSPPPSPPLPFAIYHDSDSNRDFVMFRKTRSEHMLDPNKSYGDHIRGLLASFEKKL